MPRLLVTAKSNERYPTAPSVWVIPAATPSFPLPPVPTGQLTALSAPTCEDHCELSAESHEVNTFVVPDSSARCTIEMAVDHLVTRSVYVLDPDGNRIEVYVDMPKAHWEGVPHAILRGDPLQL